MKEWKVDTRTGADIIHSMEEIAGNYTPEWKFNPEDPDIGSALALVYADMLEGTIRQLNRAGYKNQLAFFNSLGASLRDAAPARGYAVFHMAEGAPSGTEVEAGTGVTAELPDEEGGPLQYETKEDLYATPARPVCLYMTNGKKDEIYCLEEGMEPEPGSPIVLFREKGENLQSHELYLAHEEVLEIQGEAWVELLFYARANQPADRRFLEELADRETASFSYWSEKGWQDFAEVSLAGEALVLHKGKDQPPFCRREYEGKETFVVRCHLSDVKKAENLSVAEILIQSRGKNLAPQSVYGASGECGTGEYFPFGERMNLFEEIYFGSQEVLSKRGAQISLSFHMDFVKVPMENRPEDSPKEWKWIMKQSEFRPDPEYDITIEEVIWEYFNGNGWSRLFPDRQYSDVFGTRNGILSQQKTLVFTCPEDMTPVLVGACETCYIRARILKINNLYKLKGNYIAPLIGNTVFSYTYKNRARHPQLIFTENNLEHSLFTGEEGSCLFRKITEEEKILYLGFEIPPIGAPIRMLWLMENTLPGERGSIGWEYSGPRGFQEMNLADETCGLSASGMVTFVGKEDFQKIKLFGRELYWIRLRDESGFYSEASVRNEYPVLRSLWMNAAEIRHMERKETEFFTLENNGEESSFSLMRGNIDEIEVRVLEGLDEGAHWHTWKEVPDLELEEGSSRVYEIDRAAGVLRFGNGRHGQLPPFGIDDGIQVCYKCGGGRKGNVGPGEVNKLNLTMGFVTGVHNPEGLWGGLDTETVPEALRRCSASLRHRNRAVTARDYEELAREACRNIEKVRCFGGKNDRGEKEQGAVTLVVFSESSLSSLQEDIYRYIGKRMDPGILKRKQFYVTEPKLTEVQVRAEVSVARFQDIFQVRRRAQEKLRDFLDPVKGHFDGAGWNIGQFPDAMQLQNILKEIPEIIWIKKVYLLTFLEGPRGRQEVDPELIRKHPYVLPVSGEHEILVTVEGAGDRR